MCKTGKIGFRTELDARISMGLWTKKHTRGPTPTRAYRCGFCGKWHLTSKSYTGKKR